MTRAHRTFVAGQIWHITQRCHQREFLLNFNIDRRRWMYWLFQARRRYGLSVLNYIVTCNHVHLLVHDHGNNSIPAAMQLLSGRTAQEFNKRQHRRGAFWEDRYHATAVETDRHLMRCMVYIDLNMVRAGRVERPEEWSSSGLYEVLNPRKRGGRIDIARCCSLLGVQNLEELQRVRTAWINERLMEGKLERESMWTESVAVGTRPFALMMKRALHCSSPGRTMRSESMGAYTLREASAHYRIRAGEGTKPVRAS